MNIALIAFVKRSAAYRAIHSRIVVPFPSDAWYEEGVAYIVFDLISTHRQPSDVDMPIPQVIFALASSSGEILAARIVDQNLTDGTVMIQDLLEMKCQEKTT